MQPLKGLLWCLIGMALCAGASAQIYESKDAQGNSVFSDKPSNDSEAVKLAPTNSADPVEERPRPTPDSNSATAPHRASKPAYDDTQEHGYQNDSQHEHDDSYYYGGNYNKNKDTDSRSERREQRRNSANRPNQDLPGRNTPGSGQPQVDRGSTTIRPATGMRGR